MRKHDLWFALGLVVACGGDPPEVTADGTTSTTGEATSGSPTTTPNDSTAGSSGANSTNSGSSGEPEVCPPMPPADGGYDPCPGLCGGGGQCFNDNAEYAVCTRGCFMDCNCWAAPGDGDAPPRCSHELLESTSVCVLDCSGGETCPSGMACVPELEICAFPYPGSETASGSGSDGSSGGSSTGGSSTGGSSTGGSSTGGSSTGAATGTTGTT